MKQRVMQFGKNFFDKRLDFRVRLFNVLAIGGTVISIFMVFTGLLTNSGVSNILTNLVIAALSYTLLTYSYKTGKYQRCYMVTVVAIFFFLFSVLFFSSGGYHGGMPCFFVFAVLFTVFMLEGKRAILLSALEICVYLGLCFYAYRNPGQIQFFGTELDLMADILSSFVTVCVVLGGTMFIHFRMYNQQQKELEAARQEALELSEAKSNFLANMSHEIRTPINVMLGMNEMILQETRSEQVRGYAASVQNAGAMLLTLINNILDVSAIEAGKMMVVEEVYSTAGLLEELAVLGREQARKKGLWFEAQADEGLPTVLVGDVVHLKQIALNFLSNAAKYTQQGGVTLRFSWQQAGGLLRISVADTGPGIQEEDKERLFEAFRRADLPGNRAIEGTGLGLAIAKELAGLLGGHILVESVWGEGCVFSVELPQKMAIETPERCGAGHGEGTAEGFPGGFVAPGAAVLVVDDNSENRMVMRALLAQTLMRVDTAESGERCLEAVRENHYDLILMDYMMPGMDGAETLARLKALPEFGAPVVALTANVISGVKQTLLEAGFAEYLSKPVVWKDLEATLVRLLPTQLVVPRPAPARCPLSEGELQALATQLLEHGVVLEDGLRYLGGDVQQYRALAAIFVQNHAPGRGEMEVLAEKGEFARMKFPAHALKSKAAAVGANRLSATAAQVEELCAQEDGGYVGVLLPLLFLEWERAQSGLALLEKRLAALLPQNAESGSPAPGAEELAELLRQNRQPEALDALNQMMAAAQTQEAKSRLLELRQRVEEMDFQQALGLLGAAAKGEDDGR